MMVTKVFRNIRRLPNKGLLWISTRYSKALRGYALNSPESVQIQLVARCNLRCPKCPVPERSFIEHYPVQQSNVTSLEHLVTLLGNNCEAYILSLWGESLLHKELFKALHILRHKKILISTNLNVPIEKVKMLIDFHEEFKAIQELIVSVDGYDKESYETYYRLGGKFELLDSNISAIANSALRHRTILQFLDDGSRPDFAKKCVEYARSKGMAFTVPVMDQNFSRTDSSHLLGRGICDRSYVGLHVDSSYNIMSCGADPMNTLNIGNIRQYATFGALWNSKAMRQRRLQLRSNKNHYDVCKGCAGYVSLTKGADRKVVRD